MVDSCDDGPLSSFDLHGYKPSPDISEDITYLDLVLIITRTSAKLRQGSMGCLIVRPVDQDVLQNKGEAKQLYSRIIAASNNSSLFTPGCSDVHAEINAIGQIAQSKQHTTQGATVYITMPPCSRCFAALHASGIKRIVSRKKTHDKLLQAASKFGIEMLHLTQKENQDQIERINALFPKKIKRACPDHYNAKDNNSFPDNNSKKAMAPIEGSLKKIQKTS